MRPFHAALLASLLVAASASEAAVAPITTGLPDLTVDGTPHETLSQNLIDLTVDDADGEVRITLRVVNYAVDLRTGEPVFPFFTDPNVALGRTLGVSFGHSLRFEAQITSLHAEFRPDAPPALRIEATGQYIPNWSSRSPLALMPASFDGEQRDEGQPRIARRATAELAGVSELYAGADVTFSGVGPWFSGVWTADAVTHRWDYENGFVTRVQATPADTGSLR